MNIFGAQIPMVVIIFGVAVITAYGIFAIWDYILSNNDVYGRFYMKEEWKLLNKYLKMDESMFTLKRFYHPYRGYHYTFLIKDEPDITINIWNKPKVGICASIHENDNKCLVSTFIEKKSKTLGERLMSVAESRSQYDPKSDALY